MVLPLDFFISINSRFNSKSSSLKTGMPLPSIIGSMFKITSSINPNLAKEAFKVDPPTK